MTHETDTKVIDALKNKDAPQDLINLSTGVVLRGKMANPTTFISIAAMFPRPKPPIYHNKTMGRDMENPSDPDYIARVQSWQIEQGNAIVTFLILDGTELVSKPDDMPGPLPGKGKKEKDWLDRYSLLGLPMLPENQEWRYLTWVKTVACKDPNDIKLIQEVVGRLSGVSKTDVRAAEEFPGSEKEN